MDATEHNKPPAPTIDDVKAAAVHLIELAKAGKRHGHATVVLSFQDGELTRIRETTDFIRTI